MKQQRLTLVIVAVLVCSSPSFTQQGVISTVAGSTWNFWTAFAPGTGPARNAPLGTLGQVVTDAAGNVFAADATNHIVVKVSPQGTLTVVAGNGTKGYSGDGGPATSASLNSPYGVALDVAGNLYIADTQNHRIRKVTPAGAISTLAGSGTFGFSGDGGPATSAQLKSPGGVAADGTGNIYIADNGNNRIRKVTPGGTISTVAGNGTAGFSGDGGPATSASLRLTSGAGAGLAVDAAGNQYIADLSNNRIRKVGADGTITTVAGSGGESGEGTPGSPGTSVPLPFPRAVTVDAAGNLFIAIGNRVLKFAPDMTFIGVVAGNASASLLGDGGPATSAGIFSFGIALDAAGNLYISDAGNSRIRKVTQDGTINTLAGNGGFMFSGDGGPATNASLWQPYSVAVDAPGNLFIADAKNNRIRKVTTAGTIATVAGNGTAGFSGDGGPAASASLKIFSGGGVAVDGAGNLFIADINNNRIRKVSTDGTISTVAGGANVFGSTGDGGPATSASLYLNSFFGCGVAVDAAGNIYIAEGASHRVRKVTTDGTINTLAGNGTGAFTGDGGPASSASLSQPRGLAVDAAGNLYIADLGNNRVRKVGLDGTISTVAGNGTAGFSGDGGPATSASLSQPYGVAVDAAGNLFISGSSGSVRKVTPGGTISTITGNGSTSFSGDGGPATSAGLNAYGLGVDAAGSVYIGDAFNHRIRKVSFPPSFTASGVVLGAGFTAGALVPGSIISIFGSSFGSGPAFPAGLPATTLNGLQVLIRGVAAPIFYADSKQINAQVPVETPLGGPVSVVVASGGAQSAAQSIATASVRPGIFTLGGQFGNQGAILLANSNLLAMPATSGIPSQPVHVGDTVSIYCTGLGATLPAVATGVAAPASPLSLVQTPVTVTIAGRAATVSFSGLAPGFVGLYQVNAQVPTGVATGDPVAVVITQGGVASNTATIAVR